MKVILIKDLKRKGKFGDVIEVANGYATNYLIPNGFALSANNANTKLFDQIKDKAFSEVNEQRAQLTETASQIKGKTFTMIALSRDGKLYGSITPSYHYTNDTKRAPRFKINASDIIIDAGNIKFVGSYDCTAQFIKDISARFKIVIESDESDEQPELLEAILEEDEKATIENEMTSDDEDEHNESASDDDQDEPIVAEEITADELSEDESSEDEPHADEVNSALSDDTPAVDEGNASDTEHNQPS